MSNDLKFEDDIEARISKVVQGFITGLPGRTEAISQAYHAEDWNNLRVLAHKLAGAAIFGFPELGEAARRIEQAVELNRNNEIAALVADLKQLALTTQKDSRLKL